MHDNIQNPTGGSKHVPFKKTPHFIAYGVVKRILDCFFAAIALLFAALPMLCIALAVKLTSKGSAVFKQPRVGKNGELFECLKFRSMYVNAPSSCATAELAKADSYITPIGRLLRKTSLDELPQLINILKGEMSFIGPRPLIPEEEFIHRERKKNGVYNLRPGISGLAQIKGRDLVQPAEKVKLDTEYLNKIGLIEDIYILLQTVLNVISEKDIHEGEIDSDK